MTLDEVWAEYKLAGSQVLRDKLILQYLPLVKYVASRSSANLSSTIDQDDLVSYGTFGLIDAIQKFNPARGIKFETYAITRIKGAIIDELRTIDWVPRSVRAKARLMDKAYVKLEQTLLRPPTPAEVAVEAGMAEDEVTHLNTQASRGHTVPLESPGGRYVIDPSTPVQTVAETLPAVDDPSVIGFQVEEMKNILLRAITLLGERERIVFTLYYHEALTLAEIGRVMGVTESRVCQIHTKAVLQMRGRMTIGEA